MKNKIVFSLVIYGDSYIKTFQKYSLKSLKNSLSLLNNNSIEKILYLSCLKKEYSYIENLVKNNFDKIIFFEITKNDTKSNYSALSKHQHLHTQTAKNMDCDYLFFLYADFLFKKETILSALNLIEKEKKIVFTFALLLNSQKKNFDLFFNSLLDNLNPIQQVIKYDLIDDYHKSFELNAFNVSKSFVYECVDNKLFIKAFHLHPVIINLKKFESKDFDKNFYTLDNGFIDSFNSTLSDLIVAEDLNQVCIFSFDSKSRLKRLESSLKISHKAFEFLDRGFFCINYNLHSKKECWLFDNFTISNSNFNNSKNINIRYKSKNRNEKQLFSLKEIISLIKQYLQLDVFINHQKINYFFIFFYVLLFCLLMLLPKSTLLHNLYFLIRNKLLKSIEKGYISKNSSNPNMICSIYISKAIYSYSGLFIKTIKNSALNFFRLKKICSENL